MNNIDLDDCLKKEKKVDLCGKYYYIGKQRTGSLSKYNLGIYKKGNVKIYHNRRKESKENIGKTSEYLNCSINGKFEYLSRLVELGNGLFDIDDKEQHYKVDIEQDDYLEIMSVE